MEKSDAYTVTQHIVVIARRCEQEPSTREISQIGVRIEVDRLPMLIVKPIAVNPLTFLC